MAVETKAQLKTYFETGDIPTEQQFANLIDSLTHIESNLSETVKDETLYGLTESGDKIYVNKDATGMSNGGTATTFKVWCNNVEDLHVVVFTENGSSIAILATETHTVSVGLNELAITYTGLTASTFVGFYTDSPGSVRYRTGLPNGTSASAQTNGTGYAEKQHEFCYWLVYDSQVSASVSQRITSVTGDTSASGYDLQDEIDNNTIVMLPDGNITLSSTVNIPSNRTLISGKNTVLTVPTGSVGLNVNGENITIRGLVIKGSGSAISVSATNLTTDTEIQNLNGVGNEIGIQITGSNKKDITITDCLIENIAGKAIQIDASNNNFAGNATLSSININNCQIGVFAKDSGEYNNYGTIKANNCWIGICVFGGNNFFSNCNSSNNRINVVIANGNNNSHGSMANSALNHAELYGIWCGNITKGFMFTGCHTHDADFRLYNCDGFLFANGMVGGEFNMEDVGFAHITNNMGSSNLTYNPFGINATGTNNYELTNNYQIDGTLVV